MSSPYYVIIQWFIDDHGELDRIYQGKKGQTRRVPPESHGWKTPLGARTHINKLMEKDPTCCYETRLTNNLEAGPRTDTSGRWIDAAQKEYWKDKARDHERRIDELERQMRRIEGSFKRRWEV